MATVQFGQTRPSEFIVKVWPGEGMLEALAAEFGPTRHLHELQVIARQRIAAAIRIEAETRGLIQSVEDESGEVKVRVRGSDLEQAERQVRKALDAAGF